MSHRAGQVIEAVASILSARVLPKGHKVYTHRRISLASEEDQLPAHSVDFGEDQRAESKFIGTIDSVLTVITTVVATAADEQALRTLLLDLRREQHRAVMADPKLGLAFVVNTLYGGAEAPEILTDGEELVGVLASSWLVHYRMNPQDPGDD